MRVLKMYVCGGVECACDQNVWLLLLRTGSPPVPVVYSRGVRLG